MKKSIDGVVVRRSGEKIFLSDGLSSIGSIDSIENITPGELKEEHVTLIEGKKLDIRRAYECYDEVRKIRTFSLVVEVPEDDTVYDEGYVLIVEVSPSDGRYHIDSRRNRLIKK